MKRKEKNTYDRQHRTDNPSLFCFVVVPKWNRNLNSNWNQNQNQNNKRNKWKTIFHFVFFRVDFLSFFSFPGHILSQLIYNRTSTTYIHHWLSFTSSSSSLITYCIHMTTKCPKIKTSINFYYYYKSFGYHWTSWANFLSFFSDNLFWFGSNDRIACLSITEWEKKH